ncbi:MAG: hypothetical protein KDD64_00305 [Bdellovibrionales bacterium]|nr:hypothetical protein [Bdellovibrionales bacterium]
MENQPIASTKPVQDQLPSLSTNLPDLAVHGFSSNLRKAAKLQRDLLARGPDGHFLGGIVHEQVRGAKGKIVGNVVHIANPFQGEPLDIVTLPTRCTREEIEQIRSKIIPMRETYEILVSLAKAYEQRHPILIEGDTSIGKTFVVNRFMEILYGKGARPIDFYCSGQTDVSELLGKWAPRSSGLSESDKKLLDEFLNSTYGKNKLQRIDQEVGEAKDLSSEAQQALLKSKLSALMSEIGLNSSVQWEFSYGAVPKAMMCSVQEDGSPALLGTKGSGTILKVDEVGLAEPAVVMALLRIRGEAGKLAESLQLWEAGGEVIDAGPDFFVVYTTNPSDKDYIERKEIDPALARSVIWLRKGSLSDESLSVAAQKYMSFSVGNDPGHRPLRTAIDLREEEEITTEIAEIAAVVHRRYLELMKNGEAGRRQKLPGSLDHLARLASYMISSQVQDTSTGQVDLSVTLQRGVEFVYLSGLVDPKIGETIRKEVTMLLSDKGIGLKNFRGQDMLRKDILSLLGEEAIKRKKASPAKRSPQSILSDHERQMCVDIQESIQAQIAIPTLSLENSLLPQIGDALEIITTRELQEELLDEIGSSAKPDSRTTEEWERFVGALDELKCRINGTSEEVDLVA